MAQKRRQKRQMVKRPGTFTAWCKRHGFQGPSKACACKALSTGDARVKKKVYFYLGMVAHTNVERACGRSRKKK